MQLIFTRSGLLFERLLELVEQPHVFDGDHGLIGEGRNYSPARMGLVVREASQPLASVSIVAIYAGLSIK
ncbi:MAG TPA: hypothetical protein VFU31_11555, partial [Candidatus Binatia bacterium]|nr:hypothetical protein [Candidatus Binatia bacterium]